MTPQQTYDDWAARGRTIKWDGNDIFVLDQPAATDAGNDPLLVLHGFPTSSYDWAHVLPALSAERRVIMLDFLGFGLSSKPDRRYSMRMQADVAEAVMADLGNPAVAMITHDMGNTVGGELLRRALEGTLQFDITRRVLSNGSIYIDMAQLTIGQQLLLSLPDEPTDAVGGDGFQAGLAGTFSEHSAVSAEELETHWLFAAHNDGNRMLPRTIRYIEDRRKEERRYTGAIEEHPSPVGVVWGEDDPVAVVAMTKTFHDARPDAPITILDRVGHYPMVENPTRFADAVLAYL
ncbi:MAG TPA: alpha/beta hydrolase [Acidimicrobiia bacterium]|nr:alpha/beta hydrolase [Acidimicrobiia bacterium]